MTITKTQPSRFVGRRAQACDGGECEPVTVLTEPQRAADGSWEVLVEFDIRAGYLTPLKVCYLKFDSLTEPEANVGDHQ